MAGRLLMQDRSRRAVELRIVCLKRAMEKSRDIRCGEVEFKESVRIGRFGLTLKGEV